MLRDGVNALLDANREKIRIYGQLLNSWQSRINLVSGATLTDAQNRHFLDSAQLSPLIADNSALCDMGSGAGFPGLVLAILRQDLTITLVESDAKKCAFMAAVSRETDTNVSILNKRLEKIVSTMPAPDLVSARAFAPILRILEYAKPWIISRPDLKFVLPKGRLFQDEIDEARKSGWLFDADIHPSVTDREAAILVLRNIKPTQ